MRIMPVGAGILTGNDMEVKPCFIFAICLRICL